MWVQPLACIERSQNNSSPRLKGCKFIKTVVRWTWKSSFSKECVKTQLPNKLVLKIDGTKT